MKRALLALAFFSAFAANATPPSVCGNGQHTGNPHCQAPTPTPTPGNGGAGGAGGTGIGVGIAGASANSAAAANASNTNVVGVSNSVRNSNEQGQMQGQSQSNRSNNRNTNEAVGGGGYANSGGNFTTQTGGDVKVNVQGDTYIAPAEERNPVATAYAPNVSPTALCALGVSGGAQGASFGVSFGGSYTDENCVLLEQVRTTAAILKDSATAAEMMCGLPAYKAARARTGKPCADADGKRAEAILEDRPVAAAEVRLLP